jgi:hypothetical protein
MKGGQPSEQGSGQAKKPGKIGGGQESGKATGQASDKGEPSVPGGTAPAPRQAPPGANGTGPSNVASKGNAKDKGGASGQEPRVADLFHPQSPDATPRQPTPPGSGFGGSSSGGQSTGRERDEDPTVRAAAMRLQQAIKRIQDKRAQRVPGRGPGQEDPADLNRYRDW